LITNLFLKNNYTIIFLHKLAVISV
jgi:hypothetical protein